MVQDVVEFIFANSDLSSTTGLPTAFETCSDLEAGFPQDNIVFCQEFEENDYNQVFTIAFIMFLIYLGMYLLSYSQWTAFTATLLNAKMSDLITRKGYQQLNEKAKEESEREMATDRYAGMPARLYLFFAALLSFIYLLIKIVLFTNAYDESKDNRYEEVNDDYNDVGFKDFVTAEVMIMTYILVHNLMNCKSTTKLYYAQRKHSASGCSNCIVLLCILMVWIDAITSIVFLCIAWSLLILYLYSVAVGFLVCIGLILAFCCTVPIGACFIIVTMKLFSLFACGSTESTCGKFMMRVGSAVAMAILSYIILCAMLAMQFAFVEGPKPSILYINADDPNHAGAIALFSMATFVGLVSLFTGFLCACRDQMYLEDRQQLTARPV